MKRKIPSLDKRYPKHRPASEEEIKLWLESLENSAPPAPKPQKKTPSVPADKTRAVVPVKKKKTNDTSTRLLDKATAAKIRRGIASIEATLDLHGHTADTGFAALTRFIAQSKAQGLRTVLVITGKGAGEKGGVLKRMLPVWLDETALRGQIIAYDNAGPKHGGGGAWYVRIKRDNGRS
jgi:DNA-nicking Smr family endonuclease